MDDTAIEQTDEQRTVELAREERLQQFGASLAATRDRWIRARAARGWDRRVQGDLDQYHMRDTASKMAASMMDSVEQGYPVTTREAKPARSTVYIGITRQRTNASEARLCDILLPTDDKNWGIQPTPDPEGARALLDNGALIDPMTGQPVLVDENGAITTDPELGKPLTKREVALASERTARQAAEAMSKEIDDQLVECDYNGEQRKAIHDAAVMGTGVLKGPLVTRQTRKSWQKKVDGEASIHVAQMVENLKPASFRVDPRLVWEDPACGDEIQNGSGVFELQLKTAKRVRELGKQPGYLLPQLRLVLEAGPKRSQARVDSMQDELQHVEGKDSHFEHWIFWGELNRDDMLAAGVDVPEDVFESMSGCVEMINDTVVRAYSNPLEDNSIPYDFFPWEKEQGSPRGYGVPYLMRAEQAVVNAAWRQMMDNAGVTAGPQIIVNKKIVRPADNQWVLRPFKFWEVTDESADPAKAFTSVEFNSHQGELAGIIELAGRLGDQSSGAPAIVTGEKGSAPETVGGMQLLMNSANVVQRRLVKQYDDCITRQHIRRYYDYNMLYGEKEAIKGDFQVDARGSSALIVRDIQNQAVLNLLAAAANPIFAPMINAKKLFERALRAQYIDPKDILLPDDEIEKNRQAASQQVDPRIEAAKINAEARLRATEAIEHNRAVQNEVMRESEAENRRLRVMQLMLTEAIETARLANSENISVGQAKAMLAAAAIHDRTKKELAASEMLFKQKASPDGQGI